MIDNNLDIEPFTDEELANACEYVNSRVSSREFRIMQDVARHLVATIKERDRKIDKMRSRDSQLVQKINEFQMGRSRHATLIAKLKAALETAERT
jgi:hypothetical protein